MFFQSIYIVKLYFFNIRTENSKKIVFRGQLEILAILFLISSYYQIVFFNIRKEIPWKEIVGLVNS